MTGDRRALAAFQHHLGAEWTQVDMVEGAVCVSCIKPADLGRILTLAEQGGLRTELEGQKRIVQGVTDRLCAWESELASEYAFLVFVLWLGFGNGRRVVF